HAKSYKTSVELEGKSNVASVIGWGIAGLFISLFAQQLAFYLEAFLFGGTNESANTQNLMAVTQAYPIFLLTIGIAGPIMEEYIFRKVLFGSLIDYTGGIGAAVISSLFFAFIHMDGHLLVYSSMGFVFCYVYYKTKNIAAPMIAHCLMNTAAI